MLVIAIIGVLTASVAPSVIPLLGSSRLTVGTRTAVDQLGLARQIALTKNQSVYVRLYKTPDQSNSASMHYRAFQLFSVSGTSGYVPLGKIVQLPTNIIVDGGQTLSSMIDPSREIAGTTSLPGIGSNYKYVMFQFFPDGSTDLARSKAPWFLTFHELKYGDSLSRLPANYSTVQIDPYNGNIATYRP